MGRPIQHNQVETICELWAKPRNPHPWDVEFDDDSLPSGWSENFTPSASAIDPDASFSSGSPRRSINGFRKSCYAIQPPNSTTYWFLSRSITAPTNLFMWSRASFSYRQGGNNNDARLKMGFSSGPGNYLNFFFQESDTSVEIQIQLASGGSIGYSRTLSDKGTNARGQYYEYLGIQKIGSTLHFWAFDRGGHMFMVARNVNLPWTITKIDFDFQNRSSATPGNSILTVDFIRFKESATFLPGYGD